MKVIWGDEEEVARQEEAGKKRAQPVWGLILLFIGVIGLAYVHSMHPPHGLGEAFSMAMSGNGKFIKEPYYSVFMATSAVTALIGIVMFIIGMLNQNRDT